MASPQLIPTHSSFNHRASINPNSSNPSLSSPNLKPISKPSSLLQWRKFQRFTSLRCSASFPEKHHMNSAKSDDVVELPLFPLPLVLFPGAVLPLQIFEFRYRIMMHTLLHTDLRFGVIYSDAETGISGVGCVGEIVRHERLADDRFFLICKGQERFRITDLVHLEGLANEVESCMKDVIRLSNRLNGKLEKEVKDLRKNHFPTPFSFFVGSTFEGAPREQQALLELECTAARLKREKETLRNTLNYLSAASALKDVFPSSRRWV
ncbi:hypothetical protein Gogos_004081 [Gossypium gossypioides]|uniref:Lon N-terminal domain-containing protein n=1 Tax=Gossypium gossypioides TaxID=34282 RepID=A0A7J9CFC0_GOSGO|nr:hypothetical protein [Gossypium gossypioides]